MDSNTRTKEQQGKLFADYVMADIKLTACSPADAAESVRAAHNISDEDWLRYVMPHLPVAIVEAGAGLDDGRPGYYHDEIDAQEGWLRKRTADQAIAELRAAMGAK